MPTEDQLKRFNRELRRAIDAQDADSQRATARRLGVSQQTISNWSKNGLKQPDPERVFWMEKGFGLAPGTLSRHLGYVPLEIGDPPEADAYAAVMADDSVASERDALLALIRLARSSSQDQP